MQILKHEVKSKTKSVKNSVIALTAEPIFYFEAELTLY